MYATLAQKARGNFGTLDATVAQHGQYRSITDDDTPVMRVSFLVDLQISLGIERVILPERFAKRWLQPQGIAEELC
jgi:hypothetical protein